LHGGYVTATSGLPVLMRKVSACDTLSYGRLVNVSSGMFVGRVYIPYSCQPLVCAAVSRAPILHLGEPMAERRSAVSKTGAAGSKGHTQSGVTDGAAVTNDKPSTTARRNRVPIAAKKTTATRKPPSAAVAAEGATMARTAGTKPTATKAAAAKAARGTRTAAETEAIRVALAERHGELHAEYEQTISEISELQRERLTDSAGDDQADTGTKTFEREQEISLANNLLERVSQVERAIERLQEGNYGWCERCGHAIPVDRLAAFPSATLCVSCKQLEERR
jgi:DnaK suppressor protein